MSDEWWPSWFRRRKRPFFEGGFFGDVDDVFREMEEMMKREFEQISKRAPKDLVRERILPDGTKVHEWGPFVYGYSMTIGPDGRPRIRKFGNIKSSPGPGRPRIDIKEEREPLVDVMATNGEVKVIAELPGVEKQDIQLHGTEDYMMISVDTPQRKYHKEVELPVKIDPKRAKSTYKNGVLEITAKKKEEKKPKGESIEIE